MQDATGGSYSSQEDAGLSAISAQFQYTVFGQIFKLSPQNMTPTNWHLGLMLIHKAAQAIKGPPENAMNYSS